MFSGITLSLMLEGVSTVTGSLGLKDAANMKNVTKRKAKSTMGVMSIAGELFGIFNLGITFFVISYLNFLKKNLEQW
jgi:hypothetical protein